VLRKVYTSSIRSGASSAHEESRKLLHSSLGAWRRRRHTTARTKPDQALRRHSRRAERVRARGAAAIRLVTPNSPSSEGKNDGILRPFDIFRRLERPYFQRAIVFQHSVALAAMPLICLVTFGDKIFVIRRLALEVRFFKAKQRNLCSRDTVSDSFRARFLCFAKGGWGNGAENRPSVRLPLEATV